MTTMSSYRPRRRSRGNAAIPLRLFGRDIALDNDAEQATAESSGVLESVLIDTLQALQSAALVWSFWESLRAAFPPRRPPRRPPPLSAVHLPCR